MYVIEHSFACVWWKDREFTSRKIVHIFLEVLTVYLYTVHNIDLVVIAMVCVSFQYLYYYQITQVQLTGEYPATHLYQGVMVLRTFMCVCVCVCMRAYVCGERKGVGGGGNIMQEKCTDWTNKAIWHIMYCSEVYYNIDVDITSMDCLSLVQQACCLNCTVTVTKIYLISVPL